LSGICYLLNVFQNPARKSASCWIEKFPANSEKILLVLAAKQLKWQQDSNADTAFDHSHYSHHAPLTASQRLQAHKENALTERAR